MSSKEESDLPSHREERLERNKNCASVMGTTQLKVILEGCVTNHEPALPILCSVFYAFRSVTLDNGFSGPVFSLGMLVLILHLTMQLLESYPLKCRVFFNHIFITLAISVAARYSTDLYKNLNHSLILQVWFPYVRHHGEPTMC